MLRKYFLLIFRSNSIISRKTDQDRSGKNKGYSLSWKEKKTPSKAITTNPNQNQKQSRERAQIGTVLFWEIQLMRWAWPGWQLSSYNHSFQIWEIVSSFVTEKESWWWGVLEIHWKKVADLPSLILLIILSCFLPPTEGRSLMELLSCMSFYENMKIWKTGSLSRNKQPALKTMEMIMNMFWLVFWVID